MIDYLASQIRTFFYHSKHNLIIQKLRMNLTQIALIFLTTVSSIVASDRDDILKLRGTRGARKLISESVLSSVHNKGTIQPAVLEQIVEAGLPVDAVKKLADGAWTKYTTGLISMEKIESDMRELKQQEIDEEAKEASLPSDETSSKADKTEQEKGLHLRRTRRLEEPNAEEYSDGISKASVKFYADKLRNPNLTDPRIGKAIAKAALSGLRSLTGEMDRRLYNEAIEAGGEEEVINKVFDNLMSQKDKYNRRFRKRQLQ